ncbi:MAG: type II toxin-antitoxin system prevent-host-death family antitoxin [Deltaproteobacteria bacterium]|nr:type II toxin-antitoxin system prevent-host-death family antitoxin [Deltaproteobacteria bacterium]
MKWTTARARQHFSELLQAAGSEPQAVCNRNRPVAAVVDFETYRQFEEWRTVHAKRSAGEAFDELREICAGAIGTPDRSDRDTSRTREPDGPPPIVASDSLVDEALRLTGLSTRQEVVDLALRRLVQLERQREVLSLEGAVGWQGDLDELRRARTLPPS